MRRQLTKLLTDNGKEFTDRFIKGRKELSGNHKFDVECKKHQKARILML